mgnify:FL=1
MSMQHQEEITCPACQKAGNFTVWDSVDIAENPEMKDSIASLEAFHYHCPHCGTTVNIDYGFLYHDANRRFMVFYGPTENDEQRADRDMTENHQVFEKMSANHYVFRLARTKEDLLEKITIFEAGLDDRLMELTKAAALAQFKEQDKEFKVTSCHFVSQDDGSLRLVFFDKASEQGAYIDFQDGLSPLYNQFEQSLSENLPKEEPALARIDQAWTQDFLNTYVYN